MAKGTVETRCKQGSIVIWTLLIEYTAPSDVSEIYNPVENIKPSTQQQENHNKRQTIEMELEVKLDNFYQRIRFYTTQQQARAIESKRREREREQRRKRGLSLFHP